MDVVNIGELQEQEIARLYERIAVMKPGTEEYESAVKSLESLSKQVYEKQRLEHDMIMDVNKAKSEKAFDWLDFGSKIATGLVTAAGWLLMLGLESNYGGVATKDSLNALKKFKWFKK